jgi:hypothetical protein
MAKKYTKLPQNKSNGREVYPMVIKGIKNENIPPSGDPDAGAHCTQGYCTKLSLSPNTETKTLNYETVARTLWGVIAIRPIIVNGDRLTAENKRPNLAALTMGS